jgi:hypothetical protein
MEPLTFYLCLWGLRMPPDVPTLTDLDPVSQSCNSLPLSSGFPTQDTEEAEGKHRGINEDSHEWHLVKLCGMCIFPAAAPIFLDTELG